MKCAELLQRDHQVILQGVDVLEEMAARIKRGESVDPKDIESIVRFLKLFEDEHHQTKEESALFPVLMKKSGSQHERLRQMLFEHDQERSLAEGLEDALNTKSGPDFVHFAGRLAKLLRGHIYKEEFALFGLIEISLSDEQDDSIVAEFARFDECFRSEKRAEVLADLRLLESRYLRKRSA
jgi:hemerythrin-like domain-containing protein